MSKRIPEVRVVVGHGNQDQGHQSLGVRVLLLFGIDSIRVRAGKGPGYCG